VNDHLTHCFRYDELTRRDGRAERRKPRR